MSNWDDGVDDASEQGIAREVFFDLLMGQSQEGLNYTESMISVCLGGMPGGVSVQKLSEIIGRDRHTIRTRLKVLEASGMVKRISSGLWQMTPEGIRVREERYKAVRSSWRQSTRDMFRRESEYRGRNPR